jgi:hypothetical protein
MRSTALSARRAKQSIARKSWSRSSKTQNDSQRPLSRLGCARGSKRRQRLRASLEAAESYRTAFEAKTAVPGQLPPPSVMIGTIPRGARMSDRRRPRNLASSFTATGPRQWKVVGGDRVETCTFCGGGPTEAVVGSPDDDAPLPWQVAVCGPCLADTVMTRFAAVKHQRIVALAKDMSAAADEIVKLRDHARWNNPTPRNCAPRSLRSGKSSGSWRTHHCTTSLAGDHPCCDPAARAPRLNGNARTHRAPAPLAISLAAPPC